MLGLDRWKPRHVPELLRACLSFSFFFFFSRLFLFARGFPLPKENAEVFFVPGHHAGDLARFWSAGQRPGTGKRLCAGASTKWHSASNSTELGVGRFLAAPGLKKGDGPGWVTPKRLLPPAVSGDAIVVNPGPRCTRGTRSQ